MELLHYLDVEQSWLNTVEEKVKAADNLPESAEAVNQALEVRVQTTHRKLQKRCLSLKIAECLLIPFHKVTL